ncbi:imidazole glycerol phosphate synthase subunit HisH [Flavobacteriaceae bacterium]|nr:imidazole glycerol phosphate synthase subunit HisH [Flavobacteriaceae bacterium]
MNQCKYYPIKNTLLKVPHMGWNSINIEKPSSMFNHLDKEIRYYFVHSYYVQCHDKKDILTTTDYGHSFTSMVEKGNIYGAQFHPEKSHAFGLELLTNFANL